MKDSCRRCTHCLHLHSIGYIQRHKKKCLCQLCGRELNTFPEMDGIIMVGDIDNGRKKKP